MKFYDVLQLDPSVTKKLIKETSDGNEKAKLREGMFFRSILIVLFAIAFISTLSSMFGNENTPMAVVIFCILLGVRFVDFGYCIKDEILLLSLVFFILLFAPVLANSTNPLLGFLINFASFFTILFITCDKPEMGNGGLFSFAYIYLSGNPVYGNALIQRLYLTLVGLIICSLIFYEKHRYKNKEIRFANKIRQFNIYDFKYQWMLRMSLGVSAILSLGLLFNIERFMWAGFACGSLLSEYSPKPKIKDRLVQRLIGVLAGSMLFYIIYKLLPNEFQWLIGPIGGFCLGFCVKYKYKTIMNCLGALMIASKIYGVENSIAIRISDTIIGVVFAYIFFILFEIYVTKKLSVAKTA